MKKGLAFGTWLLFGLFVLFRLANAGNGRLTDNVGSAQPVRVASSSIGQHYGHSDSSTAPGAKDNGKSNGASGKVGSGNKWDKPDLRYVNWPKPWSVRIADGKGDGNGNGDNGDDNKDKKDGKNGENEDESEGFDRLWDVILLG
jgi:hypothetical protein